MGWKSGNDNIDNFIRLEINEQSNAIFIPYNQFKKIRKIGEGNYFTVYSAKWEYDVTLICLNNSQKFLDKV
jgi:hypothetical protein